MKLTTGQFPQRDGWERGWLLEPVYRFVGAMGGAIVGDAQGDRVTIEERWPSPIPPMIQQLPAAEIVYPESDGKPLSDNTKQFELITVIQRERRGRLEAEARVEVERQGGLEAEALAAKLAARLQELGIDSNEIS